MSTHTFTPHSFDVLIYYAHQYVSNQPVGVQPFSVPTYIYTQQNVLQAIVEACFCCRGLFGARKGVYEKKAYPPPHPLDNQ